MSDVLVETKREPRLMYTPEEDSVLLAIVKEAQDEQLPLTTAYMKAADELNRPVKSVTNRHRRLNKAMNGGNGSVKVLSEAERISLKLKALKRERERSAEKTDMYKERFEELQGKYSDLERRYRTLENEHIKLVTTVKDALGEDL